MTCRRLLGLVFLAAVLPWLAQPLAAQEASPDASGVAPPGQTVSVDPVARDEIVHARPHLLDGTHRGLRLCFLCRHLEELRSTTATTKVPTITSG